MRRKASTTEEGVIEGIDLDSLLFTVRFDPTGTRSHTVEYSPPYLNDSSGAFMGAMPEVGDRVLVTSISSGGTRAITSFRALGHTSGELGGPDEVEAGGGNFVGNRYPLLPGDILLASRARNRVKVAADGDVEVVANDITSTRWVPADDRIQNFALNFEVTGTFGSAEWFTHRNEEREALKSTQTGFRSAYSRIAEAPPIIFEDYGSVSDEEGLTFLQLGGVTEVGSLQGELTYRKLVFSQDMSNRYALQQRIPESSAASYAERLDDLGNSEVIQVGTRWTSVANSYDTVKGVCRSSVWGDSHSKVGGDSGLAVTGTLDLSAGRDVSISAGGDLTLSCKTFRIISDTTEESQRDGSSTATPGALSWECAGDFSVKTAQNLSSVCAKDSAEVVQGVRDIRVHNRNPQNRGQDTSSDLKKVYGGKSKTHVADGSWEVTVGDEKNPTATIKVFKDPRFPQQSGRIFIGFPGSKNGLTLSPDGSWELKGKAELKGDAAGNVTLGASTPASAGGSVITTLSHPTDFMTGLPIMGQTTVTVFPGPVAPGPAPTSRGILIPTQFPKDVPSS